MSFITQLKVISVALIIVSTSTQATLIFFEDFSNGSGGLVNSASVNWSDSSGNGFEVYGASGAGARSMSSTYDHDSDTTTAQIALPGGIEVNDQQGNELLTAQFTLNTMIQASQVGQLSFWGGVRGGNANGALVEIFNVSLNTSLTGILTPTLGSPDWLLNEFTFASTAASVGDLLEIRWQGGGSNSANGQEIALVSFSIVNDPEAASIPEPKTMAIFMLGIIGLMVTKCRNKAKIRFT
jgi:hypothetical protein